MTEPVYQHEPDPRITGEHVADVVVCRSERGPRIESMMVFDGGCIMFIAWWADGLDQWGNPLASKRVNCGSYWNRMQALCRWNARHGLSRDMSIFDHLVEVPVR